MNVALLAWCCRSFCCSCCRHLMDYCRFHLLLGRCLVTFICHLSFSTVVQVAIPLHTREPLSLPEHNAGSLSTNAKSIRSPLLREMMNVKRAVTSRESLWRKGCVSVYRISVRCWRERLGSET
ncbi:hypothetical protein BDV98DRAFT_216595 [Pterulicium gracile]|uniref:Uncharacterized protein n=1 Tax=Pterulicium gracile TaxID=1884261 RepID=A0A5C3Q867_9AGAR|nr:hypothetical protein BDV98DRAFT_216595 [Pterula gracilis]